MSAEGAGRVGGELCRTVHGAEVDARAGEIHQTESIGRHNRRHRHRRHAKQNLPRQAGKKQQRQLRALADAEPHHQQRIESERRQRPVELDQRIEQRARIARDPHENAERNADEARQREGRET